MIFLLHPAISALGFFQSTQLNVFERFLTQAVTGIDSTGITRGMQNVSYVVLLVGFLWQIYQSAMNGGAVRGLGTNLVKYIATVVVVMNYHAVFTTINSGFVNAGNWVNSASGASSLFDNWANDLKTQFSQVGFQKLWGLVTADLPGLIDALLIIVAYVLYPVVIVIFGFFYMLYGSILYIFGPIVIALMPFGATNRLAKSYAENVFIWNAWPVLYGGFGALLSAVQMGQIGQMLDQNNFLGDLGNLEGSILIGLASIIYSLAIAVIPFIAKRIVSGEVGSTAGALIGAAATALSAGVAGAEGVSAGVAAGSTGSSSGFQGSTGGTSPAFGSSVASGGNQPAPPQRSEIKPQASQSAGSGPTRSAGEQAANDIRVGLSEAFSTGKARVDDQSDRQTAGSTESSQQDALPQAVSAISSTRNSNSRGAGSNLGRGPTAALARPRGLATWGAYHVARMATRGVVGAGRGTGEAMQDIAGSVTRSLTK